MKNNFKWLNDIVNNKELSEVVLVGIRKYYGKTYKRGVFDDMLCWVNRKTGYIATYNGNTDPSSYRKGKGYGSGKGMASLNSGVWLYKQGPHPLKGGYPAFRQAADVVVTRDGIEKNYSQKGQFGINIHKGSKNGGTSSLGCQTIPYAQWNDFHSTGVKLLKDAKLKTFNYVLLNG